MALLDIKPVTEIPYTGYAEEARTTRGRFQSSQEIHEKALAPMTNFIGLTTMDQRL
jgi:hypothetical protein